MTFEDVSTMDLDALVRRNQAMQERIQASDRHAHDLREELQAMTFLNGVQEQELLEREPALTRLRHSFSQTLSIRTRKHKAELRRLATERFDYEDQASQTIAEMGSQMALIQQMTMGRIEELESELQSEKQRVEALQHELDSLRQAERGGVRQATVSDEEDSEGDDEEEEEDEEEDEGCDDTDAPGIPEAEETSPLRDLLSSGKTAPLKAGGNVGDSEEEKTPVSTE